MKKVHVFVKARGKTGSGKSTCLAVISRALRDWEETCSKRQPNYDGVSIFLEMEEETVVLE